MRMFWQAAEIPGAGMRLVALLTLACIAALHQPCHAGTYVLAEQVSPDLITHPSGYTGTGGVVKVGVCIDPASPNAASMQIPLRNVINTYNQLQPSTGNIVMGANNNIPQSFFDYESVALHEAGHCLGLGHTNLASESGLSDPDANYTKASRGANNVYGINPGADGVIGSMDDVRGDDVNLHWFRMLNNNPFTLGDPVDSTTYARDIAMLPPGHDFAANADRGVGALLGVANTESVMNQGIFNDSARRTLNHDDVATLQYAMSGIDEFAGNQDDYTVQLAYEGVGNACDIVVAFDNAQTGFAVCQVSASVIGTHAIISSANIYFNDSFNWFFNQLLNRESGHDFNGDGKSDILWRNTATGLNYLYMMNGTTIVNQGAIDVVTDPNWQIVAMGDYDGDSSTDILWRHALTGQNKIYLMNGNTIVTQSNILTVSDTDWHVAGSGDYNGDGKSDILWRHALTGQNHIWFMNGLTIASQGTVNFVPPHWQVMGSGDLDGDGKSDILWRNSNNGRNHVYLMNRNAIASQGTINTVPLNWVIAGTGDYDGDGRADILWRNSLNGRNHMYFLNGATIASQGTVNTVPLDWEIVGDGDYDGDGKADILWRNMTPGDGRNYMYFMDGNAIADQGIVNAVSNFDWVIVDVP